METANETTEAITGVSMPEPIQAQTGVGEAYTPPPAQTAEALPNAPNEHGIASISAHEDVDDFSGEKNWYWSKNHKGDGDRPEWLAEDQTVEDLAKRAHGLRKQVSQIKHAPEEYSLNFDPEITEVMGIQTDDPLINQFKQKALEADISQDGFNDILNMYFEHQAGEMLGQIEARNKEFVDMKIDAEPTFERLCNWADNNLDANRADAMKNMVLSAPQMDLMLGIINKFAGSQNLPGDVDPGYPMTQEDRMEELGKWMQGGIGSLEKINKLYGIE